MELTALLERAANLDDLTNDELAALLADLRTAIDERLDGDLDDAVLAELTDAATAVETITAAQATRADAAADLQARAEEIRARVHAEPATAEDGDGDADVEGEAPITEGEGDDAEADDAPADGGGDGGEETAPVEAEAPVPVAAAAHVTRVAARRPAITRPQPRPSAQRLALHASANVPGIQAGARIDSPDQIMAAFAATLRATAGYKGPRVQIPVLTAGAFGAEELYGEDRYLTSDPRGNDRKIAAVTSPQAIRASGGICAPAPVNYDQPILGDNVRPVRDDMLVRFGADRGGVRLFPPVTLDMVEDAVDVWTEANDVTPSNPTTKPCLVMTCPQDDETTVEAITRCLQVGNFRSRFFAEQVEAWMTQIGVWHARFAESRLLTAVGTGSTQITTGTILGTATDVLTNLDRAIAGLESRLRIAEPGVPLRFAAPAWLRDQMRVDLARTANSGTADERLAIAEAQIDAYFRVRGVNVTWFLDGETGQIFPAQPDGTLHGWPSTVITYLYPEGSWLFLDGGSLDFGIVRDSTLNGTNDFQMMAETFEAAAFHGVESLRIDMDVCPDGSTSAPVDISPCTSGS